MKHAIGIMSGTSVDALDVALLAFTPQLQTVHVDAFVSQSFSKDLRALILRNLEPDSTSVEELAYLNIELSRLAAEGVAKILRQVEKNKTEILCIGYHGQTLWHDPAKGVSYQIGDGPTLAALTGIPVVNNFRTKDMAYGGQGAPLVPFAQKILLHKNPEEKLAVHNLGGISNPSYFSEKLSLAFDTGPANLLLDGIMHKLFAKNFDDLGATAKKGKVHHEMLHTFLQEPYFQEAPPKSTGRERFGKAYVELWLRAAKKQHLRAEDVMATATAFVVATIRQAYENFILPHGLDRVIFCGGGAKNEFLMDSLKKALPVPVQTSVDLGYEPQSIECICFAILACFAFERKVNQIAELTGTKQASSLGQICYP